MGIGVSILLIAVGAILAFAVTVEPSGLDLDVVGWILMVVGILGLIITAMIWNRNRVRETRVVSRETYVPPVTYGPPRVVEREVLPPSRVVEREVIPPPVVDRVVEEDSYRDYPP